MAVFAPGVEEMNFFKEMNSSRACVGCFCVYVLVLDLDLN